MTTEVIVRGILRPKKVLMHNGMYVQKSRAFMHLIYSILMLKSPAMHWVTRGHFN